MEIRRLVRLPNGKYVLRLSVVMMLRSIWHILNGERLRRHLEWKRVTAKAEADRKRRSEAGKKAWATRRRNAEIGRALDAYDATISDTIEGAPV